MDRGHWTHNEAGPFEPPSQQQADGLGGLAHTHLVGQYTPLPASSLLVNHPREAFFLERKHGQREFLGYRCLWDSGHFAHGCGRKLLGESLVLRAGSSLSTRAPHGLPEPSPLGVVQSRVAEHPGVEFLLPNAKDLRHVTLGVQEHRVRVIVSKLVRETKPQHALFDGVPASSAARPPRRSVLYKHGARNEPLFLSRAESAPIGLAVPGFGLGVVPGRAERCREQARSCSSVLFHVLGAEHFIELGEAVHRGYFWESFWERFLT
mmetsp:Transcript_30064/g.65556  ORF Transcript_30064/g.65556 Transcript_30064/m.65556 type:complete len:264 (+) Transcript_30064:3210-4001(+)